MIKSFRSKDLAALFAGDCPVRLSSIEDQLVKRLQILDSAPSIAALAGLPSNRLESLKGDRKEQHSIRVNMQWRLCFRFEGEDAYEVELADYH
ncbi:MAG TPA: type II toxin-antitoxin system RelE/ParE family toxin [Dongiaceae bacterium]